MQPAPTLISPPTGTAPPTLAPNRTPAATATLTLHPTVSMISTCTPSPVSTPIDSSDKIAFVSQRDYYPEIYVMSPDGSGQTRLTTSGEAFNTSPSWSPSAQSPVVQHPDCTSGWTRLAAGDQAKVSRDTITPNRLRSRPSQADEIIALIHPGTVLRMIEGPICADGLIFWNVEENTSIPGGVGWTAEGDGNEYWLEPYKPSDTPPSLL